MRFLSVALLVVLLSACNGISKVLKSTDPEYKLRMAEQYYAKQKYLFAQQLYEDVLPYYKGRPEFEDIYYKYAFTAYNQKDYLNAENLFKTYLESFPNSQRAEEIEYMRAYTFYKQSAKAELDQTNTMKAMGMMQTFINTHPTSAKSKEALEIMDTLRLRLETKDFKAARLYYDIGQFRAAAVSFNSLLNAYPDTRHGDEYKLWSIKSYFRLAELSVEEKKLERFEKVIEECNDFNDRFPESGLVKEVENFINLSKNNIKNVSNESTKTST
ncbi:Beta-barrel assembly machine subunit BamD [Cnuella takakiae]|uniref:Beta-barrel assembly machine subunit BamD n=1 Tax=Cnuella takakiae TaxID=1302690 RepID=A0A1M5C4N2_9BACT|nr:outer membrane protein assembly factor BamD [Cnuella takakiae]OLY93628.1 outer membrane protein assembly factor BamD [Cnuella takakiae]SHF49661.1 Beta-barrel assembly machine subunit BamD [Cnuella takakiae]